MKVWIARSRMLSRGKKRAMGGKEKVRFLLCDCDSVSARLVFEEEEGEGEGKRESGSVLFCDFHGGVS